MTIYNENNFEEYIRELLKKHICIDNSKLYLLKNKNVADIIICNDNPPGDIFFIETKYHKSKHGRIGFGGKAGHGYQPEVLNKNPLFFKRNMRWVIGQEHSKLIFVLDNETILKYISGNQIGKKYNNIKKEIFDKETGIGEEQFINIMTNWLN